jgi:formylglycine-generating enzyme required for sulfatase activity
MRGGRGGRGGMRGMMQGMQKDMMKQKGGGGDESGDGGSGGGRGGRGGMGGGRGDSATTQLDASVIPLPDAATVKQTLTPAQLAVGDPIENSIGMVLVPIPAGEFLMGSPESGLNPARLYQSPQHQVTLTTPFLLGVHEVTQGQWQAVMGTTPWKGESSVKEGDNYPANYVNWPDAVEFCRQLSEKEGLEYRLPTEAEWEYACRAGTTTAYSFGDDASELGEYAWHKENAEQYAHTVGQKNPNPWGLYDMHGNVWEWCSDWYWDYPSGNVTDPVGSSVGVHRVLRGGSVLYDARHCRSARRYGLDTSMIVNRVNSCGFRVALSPSGQ